MKRNRFAIYDNGKDIKGFWVEPEYIHLSGKAVNSVFPKFSGRNITDVIITDITEYTLFSKCMLVWICDKGRWDYRWSAAYQWMEWRAKELFDRLHPLWGEEEDWDDEE